MKNKTLNDYLNLYMLDLQLVEEMDSGDYYPNVSYDRLSSMHQSSHIIRLLDRLQQAEDYIGFVERAEKMIGAEAYAIVMNDYFGEKYWYKSKYSTASYYRKRKKAQAAFLSYMESLSQKYYY